MREGHIILLDEISLAEDSVLERLNSVLEPSRTITLAERGGEVSCGSSLVTSTLGSLCGCDRAASESVGRSHPAANPFDFTKGLRLNSLWGDEEMARVRVNGTNVLCLQ